MKKRLFSCLLVLLLAVSQTVYARAVQPVLCTEGSVTNPLYAEVIPREDVETESGALELPENQITASTRAASFVTPRQAANQLRGYMVDRIPTATLYIETADFWAESGTNNWIAKTLMPMVLSQELSTGPYDGDYLKWSWYRYQWKILNHSGNFYTLQLSMDYYTTAQQEQDLQARIAALHQDLGLDALDPVDAYEAIYEYITSHVSYDYDGLDTINDRDPYNDDLMIFTAYGALTDGEAVCQGYATLYYAMCREAGLPVRIITSSNHAWNIVYLRNLWYCVDSTWDSSTYTHRDWFLLGLNNFGEGQHRREAAFQTEEFLDQYPLSDYDYDRDLPFTDVSPYSVHYPDIARATQLHLFSGTGTYSFSPKMSVTRAMLVTVLWRLEGAPPQPEAPRYSDVPQDSFYNQAVNWASSEGIIYGIGDGLFDPNTPATREQLVTILYRYADYLGQDVSARTSLAEYTDRDQIAAYAEEAMSWAVESRVVYGTSATTLSPRDDTLREQLASLMIRLIDRYGL